MGTINILKNGYRGKLGATVGQQWNGQLTLRTYLEHNNSKTEKQLEQRKVFGELIKGSQLYYSQVFNYNPPKGFKGTKWNYMTRGLSYIQKLTPQPGQVAKIYPDSKGGLISPYCITLDGKIHCVFINQSESSPYNFNSVGFYGLGFPGLTSDAVKEAFETTKPTPIRATFPNAAAIGATGKTVLYEIPLPPNSRDMLLFGLTIKKQNQTVYTDAIFPVVGLVVTTAQLTPW